MTQCQPACSEWKEG